MELEVQTNKPNTRKNKNKNSNPYRLFWIKSILWVRAII